MKIVTYENRILRERSKEVTDIDNHKIKRLISEMKDFVVKENGAGLSAVQVGHLLRIIVLNVGKNRQALINPEITQSSTKKTDLEEGCLSFPGFFGIVRRPAEVTVKALNEKGRPIKIEAKGLLAKVLQHEIDHLNGILFVDKMKRSSEK